MKIKELSLILAGNLLFVIKIIDLMENFSLFGHKGNQGYVAYSASEAGIIGMTNPLSKELNEYGIRVVDLAFGNGIFY